MKRRSAHTFLVGYEIIVNGPDSHIIDGTFGLHGGLHTFLQGQRTEECTRVFTNCVTNIQEKVIKSVRSM